MKRKDLLRMGFDEPLLDPAKAALRRMAEAGVKKGALRKRLEAVLDAPGRWVEDELVGPLAAAILELRELRQGFAPREEPLEYPRWGEDLDDNAIAQMDAACSLPISVAGALMADAHLGYGLPIGGVLATDNAVIPYAVGVDIACRVKMTVLDMPVGTLAGESERLTKVLEGETRFGIGAKFGPRQRRDHPVMDEDWSISPVTERVKDKAWSQLGSSGSGNHFVEWGELELDETVEGLAPGRYLALLSHSGSRGAGAQVAAHYSKLAMARHPELPKQLRHLAWLDLDDDAGREYWAAMELMGRYASANHALIHHHVAKALGTKVLLDVENHHNFAWKEVHDGREVVVHRKGATPAGEGVLGLIPGSMASPAFLVRGKGEPSSLASASHGAGRVMSRTAAKKTITWSQTKKRLAAEGVTLLSAGLDESPFVYRDIEAVMEAQRDLVTPLARFHPRIVKMAPEGERPED